VFRGKTETMQARTLNTSFKERKNFQEL
jgi:hypothetical protein